LQTIKLQLDPQEKHSPLIPVKKTKASKKQPVVKQNLLMKALKRKLQSEFMAGVKKGLNRLKSELGVLSLIESDFGVQL